MTANIVTVQASFVDRRAKLNVGARNKYQPISTERTVAIMPGQNPQTSAAMMIARL
jgi:hypothetical protein